MRRLLTVLGIVAVAAAILHLLRRPAGHAEADGILVGDASGYDRLSGALLGTFYDGVAADAAAMVRPGGRVLDIGAGPGQLAGRLAAHGLVVTAVDLDPAMVARAQERLAGRAETAVASVADLPYPDAFFDLVVSTLSMHHWADKSAGLAEIARVLAPTGLAEIARVLAPTGRALIWDLEGRVPLHGNAHGPVEHVAGSPLYVVASERWRWPGPFSLTRRLELRRNG